MPDNSRGVGQLSGDTVALSECEVTPDDIAFQVRSSRYGRIGIVRSSEEGLIMGRHKKAPVHFLCSRLSAHRGAPRTHCCGIYMYSSAVLDGGAIFLLCGFCLQRVILISTRTFWHNMFIR